MTADKKLWVPGIKLNEREKEMAWRLFLEVFKQPPFVEPSKVEAVYKRCLQAARTIAKIEDADQEKL